MKASLIKVRELKTVQDCYAAVEAIEDDWLNVQGGLKAWTSGDETHLTSEAQRKVDALHRKIDKLFRCGDQDDE